MATVARSKSIIIGPDEGVNFDGRQTPSGRLAVEKAVEVYRKGRGEVILFSGFGNQHALDRVKVTGAMASKQYAIELGVRPEVIWTDEQGKDTLGEAYFCKQVVAPMGFRKITLVAGPWHMERTAYVFEMAFGSGYDITQVTSDRNGFRESEIADLFKAEKVSLELLKSYFREFEVQPGDEAGIRKVFERKYKIYTPNPQLTEEQQKMIAELGPLRRRVPLVRESSASW